MVTIQRWNRPIMLILLTLVLTACGQSTSVPATSGTTNATAAVSTANAPVSLASDVAPTALPIASPAVTATQEPSPAAVTALATVSSAPIAASGSPLDAITVAYQAAVAAKSYRVQSTITSEKTSVASTYEIVKPDRLHWTTAVKGRTSERMYIGATTYARANGGAWTKSSDTTGAGTLMKQFSSDAAAITELTKNIKEAKVVGTDTLDGKPMTVYQYKLAVKVNDAGAQSSSVAKLWIGADTRPYKLELDGSSNITGKVTTSHTVNLYSDYDSNIKIEAPIP